MSENPSNSEKFQRLTVVEIKNKMNEGWKPYVLDVRRQEEADISKLDFVDRLHPHDQIEEILSEIPKDKEILIHCRSGMRSADAAQVLCENGFSKVYNMEGGINQWAEEIDSSLPTY